MGRTFVTMAAFQRAYADLAGSPRLCLDVRADPAAALAAYDLDERERARLANAVWQRGMRANCTVYRVTRITALNAVAPLALRLIGPALREVVDAYWDDHPVHDLGFARETKRFITWLETHPQVLPAGALEIISLARRELAAAESVLESDQVGPSA